VDGQEGLERAFEIIEKAKSRELAEQIALRSNAIPSSSKSRSSLAEQVKTLREELHWYYRQVDKTDLQSTEGATAQSAELRRVIRGREDKLVKTLDILQATDEEFHTIQTAGTIPIGRIRESLSVDETILEYYAARGYVYACVLQQKSLFIVPVTTVERTRNLLHSLGEQWSKFRLGDEYVAKFASGISEGTNAILTALHAALIEPVIKHLNTNRLIIIPDGLLNYLPFHAFLSGTQYLTERYVISYAGSASAYYMAVEKNTDSQSEDMVAPSDQEPFLHIRTQLRSREDNWLLSTFLFGEKEVSILDSYNLHLPYKLVGLSGTGPGLRSSGNGAEIKVLARGLQYAGAHTVLMPLWNVEGESTAFFLELFYELLIPELDNALALQKAITEVRKGYPHPYYWASFILRGAPGRHQKSDVL
jgi:hypothetical protein